MELFQGAEVEGGVVVVEAVEVEVVEVVAGVEEEDFGGALDMAVEEKGILQWRLATITAITMSRTTLMRFAFSLILAQQIQMVFSSSTNR